MNDAARKVALFGVAAGFAWWLYRHLTLRKVSADSTAWIDTATVPTGDGSEQIFIGEKPFTLPTVAPIDTAPSIASGPLDFIGSAARKIASVINSWTTPRGEEYRPLFDAAETKHGIPRGLLFRQAYQESRFRPDIISGATRSSAGAVGIMQIIPKWHPELDKGDAAADERAALDPPRAIAYAAKYLSQLKKRFGSWELALAAYNAGPTAVEKYKGIPPYIETQNYVAQIIADVPVSGVA